MPTSPATILMPVPQGRRGSRGPARSLRLVAAGVVLAFCGTAAKADAVDCDKLSHSTAPYEVTMKVGETEVKYQVTRSDNHLTTLIVRQPDGTLTKLVNQGMFPKSVAMPDGQTANFEYSVPTDKPLYDTGVKQIDIKLKHNNDTLMSAPLRLEYLPDEKITLGSCTFDTKHYIQSSSQNGRESRNEIWFSPALDLGIKGVSTLKAGDKSISKQTEATGLTTSFKPFQ